MATTFDPKLPGESESFGFDFTKRLPGGGVTITSATVTATPAGLTVGSAAVSVNVVYALVSGGTAGVVYDLLATATLSNGEVVAFCSKVKLVVC